MSFIHDQAMNIQVIAWILDYFLGNQINVEWQLIGFRRKPGRLLHSLKKKLSGDHCHPSICIKLVMPNSACNCISYKRILLTEYFNSITAAPIPILPLEAYILRQMHLVESFQAFKHSNKIFNLCSIEAFLQPFGLDMQPSIP